MASRDISGFAVPGVEDLVLHEASKDESVEEGKPLFSDELSSLIKIPGMRELMKAYLEDKEEKETWGMRRPKFLELKPAEMTLGEFDTRLGFLPHLKHISKLISDEDMKDFDDAEDDTHDYAEMLQTLLDAGVSPKAIMLLARRNQEQLDLGNVLSDAAAKKDAFKEGAQTMSKLMEWMQISGADHPGWKEVKMRGGKIMPGKS